MNRTANTNWQRVREIFDDALRHPPVERSRFVRTACAGDEPLRAEVESLLESLDSADVFLETPAVIQVAENTIGTDNRLSTGEMLLHYEVRDLIGSGGMGEVYLARDTRLNRNVAIKVLRASFLPDDQAARRLLREARAAAVLEHPNICQIYEISEAGGHSFIVMPYLVGKTLAEILATERLPIAKAIDLATQIADGLSEAHALGIIHRDIKPANIVVNEKGQAKILDFGLAKFIEAESNAETSQRLNTSGAVMGTVPFMSPEQLRGKTLDPRSDVFGFGSLLYEMLAGKPAFSRESNAETISAILNDEPDWSLVPAELHAILKKCLAKRVDRRYESAAELSKDLRSLRIAASIGAGSRTTSPDRSVATDDSKAAKRRQFYFWQSADAVSVDRTADTVTGEPVDRPKYSTWLATAVSLIVVAIGLTVVWLWFTREPASNFDALRPVKLVSWKTGAGSNSTDFRISHDGKIVAYTSSQTSGEEAIYIKQTGGGEEVQVTKDEWINLSPLFSPDDQQIAYVSIRGDGAGIYLSPTFGGVAIPLMLTDQGNISLRHWSRDGVSILYEQAGNLYRLDVRTHESSQLTQFPDSAGYNRYFNVSRDEQQLVFCDKRDGQFDIWTMPLAGGEPARITNDKQRELRPLWHPDGKRILFNVIRSDYIQIDVATIGGGEPPAQVTRGVGDYALIDISDDGERIYHAASERKSDVSSVNLETGQDLDVASESENEFWPDASRDGKSIVYHLNLSPNPSGKPYESVLMVKTSDGQVRRLAAKGYDARWLPDSRHISVFRLVEGEKAEYAVWLIDTVTGDEKRITLEDVFPPPTSITPFTRVETSVMDFSPDSKRFVYLDMRKPANAKIGSLDGADAVSITNNENPDVRYMAAKFSLDGSQVAITELEQGKEKPIRRIQVFGPNGMRELFSTTDSVRMLGWSDTGEVVFATAKAPMTSSPVDLQIFTTSLNGSIRKLFSLAGVFPRTLTIAPDGKTAAFVVRTDGREDIWTVWLQRGAEPRKVTSNGNSRLFLTNLAFSADGKTIYFDKQEEINSISMFENFS